jgi:citrate lyase gamma subunit
LRYSTRPLVLTWHLGWLTKEGKKSGKWQMRWFVLKDHKLSYFRSKLVSEPAGTIEMSHAHVKVSSIDRVNTFEIIIPNRIYYIQTDNSSDFFAWQEVIKQSINQYNVIYRNLNLESSGALELIRQIGPDKTLQAVYEEKVIIRSTCNLF